MLAFLPGAVQDAAGCSVNPERKHPPMGERREEERENCCWGRWEAVMAGGESLFSEANSTTGSPLD